MKNWRNWLKKHAFEMHSLAFILMFIAAVGSYLAARSGANGAAIAWLSLFVAANVLVLLVR